jgi:hypothetical protein
MLLPSQAAKLHELLKASGLDPSEFQLHPANVESREPLRIVHSPSSYYFALNSESPWEVQFSPGVERVTQRTRYEVWSDLLTGFASWVSYVRRELSAPNPWLREEAPVAASPVVVPAAPVATPRAEAPTKPATGKSARS